jgi:hypothetical protein
MAILELLERKTDDRRGCRLGNLSEGNRRRAGRDDVEERRTMHADVDVADGRSNERFDRPSEQLNLNGRTEQRGWSGLDADEFQRDRMPASIAFLEEN